MKTISFLAVMLVSIVSYAHQPDLSTTVLSTTGEGKYILQITSALTAFEGEIDFLYSTNAYKTPDEFKISVVEHFNKSVLFIVNGFDTLKFSQPLVILGHETKLIAEVLSIPKDIRSVYFKNSMFKDMPQNQMAVMLLSDGFPKEKYVLKNENDQTIQLSLKDGMWIDTVINKTDASMKSILPEKYLLILSMVLIIPLFYFGYRIKRNVKKQKVMT